MQDKLGLKVELYSEAVIPTQYGEFLISIYRDNQGSDETVLISKNLSADTVAFVRIHSECLTGEVFGSLKCDCRSQLSLALTRIQEKGSGAVVYLRQEGRGIGLGNKIKAYALQNEGKDTVEANHILGFATDLRSFDVAALILKDRGINKVILNTNNPDKISTISDHGIEIVSREPSLSEINPHNKDYLQTKFEKLGHHLKDLF